MPLGLSCLVWPVSFGLSRLACLVWPVPFGLSRFGLSRFESLAAAALDPLKLGSTVGANEQT
jgi:hypothetical protein